MNSKLSNEKEIMEGILLSEWYIQACSTTPIFIMAAGLSVFSMEKGTGISYSQVLFETHENFGKMCYYTKDLIRINDFIKQKTTENPHYLEKLKQAYDEEQIISSVFYKKIDSQAISNLTSEELSQAIKNGISAIDRAVGIGHIIEPFALIEEEHIKSSLRNYIKDTKEFNESFIVLTTPSQKSFIQESQDLLLRIKNAANKDPLIDEYLKKYFWSQNTYVGRHIFNREEILQEAKTITRNAFDLDDLKRKKQNIIEKYAVTQELIAQFSFIEFITKWQDERKAHILIGIDYLDRLLEEKAKREMTNYHLLKFYTAREYQNNIVVSKEELSERSKGVCFYFTKEKDFLFIGNQHKKINDFLEYVEVTETNELNGVAASLGNAMGKVKICTTVPSLSKVKEGDILVASMTRPEYLPAMKKAAAFITDEGGITCHAAIVAREMRKPCVIGTKNATKVLKDNDVVEVKGNHGLVIIRERSK